MSRRKFSYRLPIIINITSPVGLALPLFDGCDNLTHRRKVSKRFQWWSRWGAPVILSEPTGVLTFSKSFICGEPCLSDTSLCALAGVRMSKTAGSTNGTQPQPPPRPNHPRKRQIRRKVVRQCCRPPTKSIGRSALSIAELPLKILRYQAGLAVRHFVASQTLPGKKSGPQNSGRSRRISESASCSQADPGFLVRRRATSGSSRNARTVQKFVVP